MKQPIITTIIPTYKRPLLLKRAVESVLAQSYPHLVVCVFDNCSQDETESVILEIMERDNRVRYHCHARNLGAGANFQYALNSIKTEYFTILSDDDWLLPSFFEKAIQLVNQHPDVGIAALSCRIERNGRVVRPSLINKKIKGFYTPPDSFLMLLNNWAILTWTSILFNKAILDKIGLPLKDICMPNDLEFILRIAAYYPIVISDDEGAVFTDHPDSASAKSDLQWIWPCYPHIIEHIMETYELDEQILKQAGRLLYNRFQKRLVYSFISSIHQNNWNDAEKALSVFGEYSNHGKWYHILELLLRIIRTYPKLFHPVITLFIQQKHTIVYILDKMRT